VVHPPKAPVNDWLWRTVKENGTVSVPLSIYDAHRLGDRHDLEIEEFIEDQGEGVVVLRAHQDYKATFEGMANAVDTETETLPAE